MAGEVLRGDRIVNTPFQVLMNSEKKCEVLCGQSNKPVTLTVEQSRLVAERISEDYYVHLWVGLCSPGLEFPRGRALRERRSEGLSGALGFQHCGQPARGHPARAVLQPRRRRQEEGEGCAVWARLPARLHRRQQGTGMLSCAQRAGGATPQRHEHLGPWRRGRHAALGLQQEIQGWPWQVPPGAPRCGLSEVWVLVGKTLADATEEVESTVPKTSDSV